MVAPYRSEIDVVYFSKSDRLSLRQEDNKAFVKDELCKNALKFETINDKKITNAIYTYIKEQKVDMLVMVNTRHSFLENILYQSTIDEMSLYIDIPFLALQNIRR